jgi:hypothetical protein
MHILLVYVLGQAYAVTAHEHDQRDSDTQEHEHLRK